jgi:CHAT domain-containing protein
MARLSLKFSSLMLSGCVFTSVALGQERSTFDIEVYPDQPRLLIVQQLGVDIEVDISAPSLPSRSYDSPMGRTGPELIVLEARETETVFVVTIDSPAATFSLENRALVPDSRDAEIARHLSEAAFHYAKADEGPTGEAVDAYALAAGIDSASWLGAMADFLYAQILTETAVYDQSLEVVRAIRDPEFLADFQYKRDWLEGSILFAQDLYVESAPVLHSALEQAQDSPLDASHVALDIADIQTTLGFNLVLNGQPDQGKVLLDAALRTGEDFSDLQTLGRVHNNLGGYYSVLGDQERTAYHLGTAVDFLRESSDIQSLVYTLSNLSMTYRGMGQYQLARETGHMALAEAEKAQSPTQLSSAYTGLTRLYLTMGEYQMAEDFARQSWQYDSASGREWRTYTTMNMQGDALLGLGRAADAIDRYQESAGYFRRNGPDARLQGTLQRLVRAYLENGDLPGAREVLNEAKELAGRQGEGLSRTLADSLVEIEARLLLGQGQAEQAIALLADNLDAEITYLLPKHVEAASLLMEAHAKLGNYSEAVDHGLTAVGYIEEIRSELEYARLGPAWSQQTYPVFLNTVDALLELYHQTSEQAYALKAFEISERGYAFNLAQQRESSLFNSKSDDPRSRELLAEVTQLARRRAALGSNQDANLDLQYFKALERYQAALDSSTSDAIRQVPTAAEIQRSLDADTALVNFVCTPGKSCYRFTLSQDQFSVSNIGLFDDLEIFAAALQSDLRNPNARQVTGAGRLGGTLFDEAFLAELAPAITHLQLVSTYPLDAIPYAMLEVAHEGSTVPLLNAFTSSRIPSATTLLQFSGQQRDEEYDFDLAVLADPQFNPAEFVQLASVESTGGDTLRGWYDGLERLPWSAREAENLQEIFTDQNVRSMTGIAASKTNLLDESTRNSRIVHIASHGYFNRATPDLVGIATSPNNEDSGFVTLEEILMHPFNSELVVISGCETGLGESRGGEGMMSLARAFIGQGVDHVVATQWPVSDRASAEFMRLFYTALETDRLPVAEALRAAQLQLQQNPRYRAPFYWAPYVLTSAVSD